jgi:hypothetical protein
MARMLDVLDRQLHSDAPRSQDYQTKGPDSSSKESAKPQRSENSSSKSGISDEDRNGARSDGARSAFRDAMKSTAEKLAGQMGRGRLAQRAEMEDRMNARNAQSGQKGTGDPEDREFANFEGDDFALPGFSRVPNRDWGKLRDQRALDAVEGRRDEFDPEFEEAIQAYYRGLSKR